MVIQDRVVKHHKCDTDFCIDDLSIDEIEYLNELFPLDIKRRELVFIGTPNNNNPKQLNALKSSNFGLFNYFSKYDLMFTPCTFKTVKTETVIDKDGYQLKASNGQYLTKYNQSRHTYNLFNIPTVALDIDFKKVWLNDEANPLSFFNDFLLTPICQMLPYPSYIEYGHNLRLIWVLKEPIKLTNTHNKTNLLNTLNTMLKRFCDMLNDYEDVGAEPQKINSFYRVPCSINTKNNSTVRVIKFSSERYTFQEMMDYLPELPKWYDKWKDKKFISKKGNVIQLHNSITELKYRLSFFEKLTDRKDINRYMLCYHYAQTLCQLNEYSLDKVYEFNQKLVEPLKEKELESKLRQIEKVKNYKYKRTTIATDIGIGDDEFMTKREMEKLEKIKNGTTRKQIADANYSKVKELYLGGKKRNEIAELVNLSPTTVRDMITKIRKEIKNND